MSVVPDSHLVCRSRSSPPAPPPQTSWPTPRRRCAALAEVLWSARSDDELVDVVGQVQQVTAALAAVEAGAVAEADARDLATQQLHYGSTVDWLTHLAGLRHGEGKQRVARAKALTGSAVSHPGGTGGRHLLTRPGRRDRSGGGGSAGPGVDPPAGGEADAPPRPPLNATELAKAGRHLVEVVDPDAADRRLEAALEREERAAHLDRPLSIVADRAGGVRIRGRGTAEDGALLKAALLPLTRPQPADGTTGERRRRGHRRTLRAGPGPPRPRRPPLGRPRHPRPTRPGHRPGPRDPRHPRPAPGHPRPPHPQDDASLESRVSGWRPPPTAIDLPPGVVRRLACDAELIPAVLRHPQRGPRRRPHPTPGHPRPVDRPRDPRPALHLPHLHPTTGHVPRPPPHPLGRRRRPPHSTTSPCLCGHHHRVIHHTPWDIRLNPHDRKPEFLPPPKPGITPNGSDIDRAESESVQKGGVSVAATRLREPTVRVARQVEPVVAGAGDRGRVGVRRLLVPERRDGWPRPARASARRRRCRSCQPSSPRYSGAVSSIRIGLTRTTAGVRPRRSVTFSAMSSR